MILINVSSFSDKEFSLSDKDGEFGFLKKNKGRWQFKLTEEKYLSVDDMETIASYMRTIEKYEGIY